MEWGELRPLLDKVARTTHIEPGAVADIDRFGAAMRDRLDEFGLSVRDEATLFTLLAGLDVAWCTFVHLQERGGISEDELITACSTLSILTRGLAEYLPAGVL